MCSKQTIILSIAQTMAVVGASVVELTYLFGGALVLVVAFVGSILVAACARRGRRIVVGIVLIVFSYAVNGAFVGYARSVITRRAIEAVRLERSEFSALWFDFKRGQSPREDHTVFRARNCALDAVVRQANGQLFVGVHD